jgi:hypothetical protein
MGRFAYITTPIPTLDEVGRSLKMSKARQKSIIQIVENGSSLKGPRSHRIKFRSASGEFRNLNRAIKPASSRTVKNPSGLGKKIKRAASR